MAALPSFGDISTISQEHSTLFQASVVNGDQDITTVDESQSQSLLQDIVPREESQSESQSQSLLRGVQQICENKDDESQSQSLLKDAADAQVDDSQSQSLFQGVQVSGNGSGSQSQSLLQGAQAGHEDEQESPMDEAEAEQVTDSENSEANGIEDEDEDELPEPILVDLEPENESEPIDTEVDDFDYETEMNSGETETPAGENNDNELEDSEVSEKIYHLPLSKIKRIMKTDEDTNLIAKDALVATAIITEHFISMIAQQSYKLAAASKKKTVSLNHVKSTLTSSSAFDFLEGTIPQFEI